MGFCFMALLLTILSCFSHLKIQADEGYDPKKSKVSADRMENWRGCQISGDLLEVPGIGPAAVKALADGDDENERVTNTHQVRFL
jgi:hypothetical protein